MKENKLTPVMQQYLDMKDECPGAVLLFRLGDFYECFFGDAKIVATTLDLVLTHRGTDERGVDIPMCGIPWHAGDNYMARLVRAGHKVAIAEQMETPEEARQRKHKQIERKVIRILTPGTLTDDNLLSPKKSNFLISVYPNGKQFFIAGCDISTGEFFVGTLSDNLFDEMTRVNPSEILYPEDAAEMPEIMELRAAFKTTPVYEKLYIRADIDEIVQKIFGNIAADDAIKMLSAYLHNTQRGAALSFRAPYKLGGGSRLLIDASTWQSLEIDGAMSANGVTLLDILDKTKSAAGGRKLRAYLRELSGDLDEIKSRQEHIGHLVINSDVASAVRAMLTRIPDISRSISRLNSNRGTPRDLKCVAEFLMILPNVSMLSARLDADLAARFADMPTFDSRALELKNALNENLPAFIREGGIIRAGFDQALDHALSLSHGAKELIAALQAEYAAATFISTLKIKYNGILGYHIEVPSKQADKLFADPNSFIHRQTMAGNVRFTTARLIDLDNDVRGAAERASAIEQEIIAKLIAKILEVSEELLKIADNIADLDVWAALAECAIEYNWKRPEMTKDIVFEIAGGRHPVVEKILRDRADQFVKNDCDLSDKKIALLTGPNMAGKSTYLRQNALIVVLSHLGCFVPADHAKIGVTDQLFSRVGASDNLAAGQSTFMVEMTETANILNRATEKSFIIFDEIGRGTATFDGLSIAQAVLEFLNNLAPRALFATHYHELTETECANVANLTVQVSEYNNEIIFMHKIIPGAAESSYGIHVAKMAGMPDSVVRRAEQVLAGLEQNSQPRDDLCAANKTIPVPARTHDLRPSVAGTLAAGHPAHEGELVSEPAKSQMSLF